MNDAVHDIAIEALADSTDTYTSDNYQIVLNAVETALQDQGADPQQVLQQLQEDGGVHGG